MTKLQKYMLDNRIISKHYLTDEEIKASDKDNEYDIITQELPVKKFYRLKKTENGEEKVYIIKQYNENNKPEDVLMEIVTEPVETKTYFELIYNGDMTKQDEIKLITEMKKAKLFTALTIYLYTMLIFFGFAILIGLIILL